MQSWNGHDCGRVAGMHVSDCLLPLPVQVSVRSAIVCSLQHASGNGICCAHAPVFLRLAEAVRLLNVIVRCESSFVADIPSTL